MTDTIFLEMPVQYEIIVQATKKLDFKMASDMQTGSLLKTLAASKPSGRILELGTGTGLATSWIIDGMDDKTQLITIENNGLLLDIAREALQDRRVEFILADGYEWIQNYSGEKFDLVFADAMPGKYDLLEETIALVKAGGLYIVDDMLPQPNWPGGHSEKVKTFITDLEKRKDVTLTKLNWSTGLIIVTKLK
ncbi:MAG: methyltransferase domain-containing protein [Bacteroidetes bacterium]|nr:MAG: methyltransferase domain-containing protein [Bacteroidota bacterium]